MVTLSSCLICQIISFILSPNEYGCVYVWATLGSGPAIDLQKMPILAKEIIFSDEADFDLGVYVNKQNYHIWSTENPHAYIKSVGFKKTSHFWFEFWSRGIIGFKTLKLFTLLDWGSFLFVNRAIVMYTNIHCRSLVDSVLTY